jgi:5'-3' exonuclease
MKCYATLDELYARLDTVHDLPVRGAAKLVERLTKHREAAYLARELTRIRCDMLLPPGTDHLRRRNPDHSALDSFFDHQGFGSLLRKQALRLVL